MPIRVDLTRSYARSRCLVAKLDVNFPLPSTSRNKLTFPFRSRINIADADMLGGAEWENPSEKDTTERKKNYLGLRKNMGHSSELVLAPIILLPLHSFTLLSRRVKSARGCGSSLRGQASCSNVNCTSGENVLGFIEFSCFVFQWHIFFALLCMKEKKRNKCMCFVYQNVWSVWTDPAACYLMRKIYLYGIYL